MIVDEGAYLEHFGKKGMRWGHRKAKDSGDTPKKTLTKKEQAERKLHRIKVIKRSAAAVVVGGVATGIILHRVGEVKVTNLRKENLGFVSAKDNLDRKMSARMADLKNLSKMTQPGHPSHEGAQHEIKNLVSFYQTKLVKLAEKNGVDAKTFAKMKMKAAI